MGSAESTFAELNRAECLRLLEGAHLGRVGVSVDALPAIFPVFLVLLDDVVVFRTIPGTKLNAASEGAIVAIEVDDFDPETEQGWSVLVRGVAHELGNGRRGRAREQLAPRWMHGAAEHFVEVSTDLVTGRRIA